jgi:hypothetical protein
MNSSPTTLYRALYRVASGLLVLFAILHTIGFRQTDPQWGLDSMLTSMRAIHFDVGGFSRTYWDFYSGAGFTVGAFFLFAAVLTWQLAGLSQQTLRGMTLATWGLAILFVVIAALSWVYLFILPLIFASVVSLCLITAAWLASKEDRRQA